jgi:arginyl-tRNA synthetase
VHVPFGTVLGTDGKPLKTRSGVNVTLKSLLEDAQEAAGSMMMARAQERGLPTEGVRDLARAVGVGALKYADLSSDRVRDYTFTLEKMVALDGDTGPYLQYAHARTCSLLAKVGAPTSTGELTAAHPKEVELALVLDQFGAAVALAAAELSPHRVCTYLHTLATTLSSFYEACNVSASTGTERASRLALVELTRRVLARGLGLLGIEAPERL